LRHGVHWLLAILAAVAAGSPATVSAQPPSTRILDVPYLPQSEALCGGAAAAMVMRYWGARDVYPDAFAPLIEPAAGGIRTGALTDALDARGWTAMGGGGAAERVQQQLDRGRPVIALIEDRPSRYHYVVVVGWVAGKVIVHDPARTPFRVLDEQQFQRAWEEAGNWMLVLLPPPGLARTSSPVPTASGSAAGDGACAALVEEGVRLAQTGDHARARSALVGANASCPNDAAPLRELAGLDALEQNWPDAEEHARAAAERDPRDVHAWQIAATAAYLQHRDREALEAWNHAGQPTVDLLNVKGLERTRYAVAADAIELSPGTLVTPERLRLAQQRLRDVPAVAGATVSYHPVESGRAQIDAVVLERALAPTTPFAWSAVALHAATERELAASLASVTGGGELVTGSWRWWEHRPRVAFSFAAPVSQGIAPGVWRVDAFRETESFGNVPFTETRTSVSFAIARWLNVRTRIHAHAGIDRWRGRGLMPSFGGVIEFWPLVDRLEIEGRIGVWANAAPAFATRALDARWRSSPRMAGMEWLARGGLRLAGERSPASLWSGGDTGHARDVLLRAHPLLDDGVINGSVFGRRVIYAGTEARRWTRAGRWPIRIAPAAFVDIARAWNGLAGADSRGQVDLGGGVRVSLATFGTLRLDVAHGLRDGRNAVSFGWER
jgi:Peptidase_C39 like family